MMRGYARIRLMRQASPLLRHDLLLHYQNHSIFTYAKSFLISTAARSRNKSTARGSSIPFASHNSRVFKSLHYSRVPNYTSILQSIRRIHDLPPFRMCTGVYVVKSAVYLNGYKWVATTWCEFVDPRHPSLVRVGTVVGFYKFVFDDLEAWAVRLSACPVIRYEEDMPIINHTVFTETYMLEYRCLKFICHLTNHWTIPTLKCVVRAGSVEPQ